MSTEQAIYTGCAVLSFALFLVGLAAAEFVNMQTGVYYLLSSVVLALWALIFALASTCDAIVSAIREQRQPSVSERAE